MPGFTLSKPWAPVCSAVHTRFFCHFLAGTTSDSNFSLHLHAAGGYDYISRKGGDLRIVKGQAKRYCNELTG